VSSVNVAHTDRDTVTTDSMEIRWEAVSRFATVRYTPGTTLRDADGVALVDALTGWIGAQGEPFGVLADGTGLHGTDGEYRARMSAFFRLHRGTVCIALVHVNPVIQIVVEMFRLGTGIPLKTFSTEAAARWWLRTRGITA
jgi:hypothetical protein